MNILKEYKQKMNQNQSIRIKIVFKSKKYYFNLKRNHQKKEKKDNHEKKKEKKKPNSCFCPLQSAKWMGPPPIMESVFIGLVSILCI